MSISLRDLAPMTGEVEIRGQVFTFHGVSAHSINVLLTRFSAIRKIMVERGDALSNDDIRKFAPDAICAIIAESKVGRAYGRTPEEREALVREEEDGARELTAGEQFEILQKIIEITFPRGVGPLVAMLQNLGVVAPAATARSGDTGKAQATKSVSPSSESPAEVTIQ